MDVTTHMSEEKERSPFTRIFDSSIGRKLIMAVTGLLMLGFVIAHLLGNLQLFLGWDAFNAYAKGLQDLPQLIWPARIGLLAITVLHIVTAVRLRKSNSSARPVKYSHANTIQASTASLYMVETGIVILLFIIVHLLHFTFHAFDPGYAHLLDPKGRHDVYTMVVRGFQNPLYAGSYIIAMALIGMHLSHGISSAFHTLGFYDRYFTPRLKMISIAVGYGIAVGYIAIPAAVQFGLIGLRSGGVSL